MPYLNKMELPVNLQGQLDQLRRRVYDEETKIQGNKLQIDRLREECDRLLGVAHLLPLPKTQLEQQLSRECSTHAATRAELESTRARYRELEELNACLRQNIIEEKNAHLRVKEALNENQNQIERMSTELTQYHEWCRYVDKLVDVRRLEEDINCNPEDRSRGITDIIRDITKEVEEQYNIRLRQRDEVIMNLTNTSLRGRSTKRGDKKPSRQASRVGSV